MKVAKRIFALMLSVVLVFSLTVNAFAATSKEVAAEAGETVTVELQYTNIAGIQGTLKTSGADIITGIAVTTTGLTIGNYNAANGMLAYFGTAPVNCTVKLEIKLAADAKPGEVGKITFEYETTADGSMPSEPVYQYDSVTILVPAIDYTALNAQIAKAESLNEADYTAASWAKMETALAAAIAARESQDQKVVDNAANALKAAIAALVRKQAGVDYSELNKQIAIAEGLNEADYTAESWANLESALNAAIAARSSQSQSVVNNAAAALKAAIAALEAVPGVDYSELELQILIASGLREAFYTPETWADLASALETAITARESKDQAEVDAAAATLKEAIAGLERLPVINYAELSLQIAIAEGLNEADYTAESWANLEIALEAARAARESLDQAEVANAAENLKNAIAALEVPVAIDYTELNAQIAIAEGLNADAYTAESWAALTTALNAAIDARTAESQDIVDNAAADLKAAIAALQTKPVEPTIDYTVLNAQIAIAEGLNKDDYTAESWSALETALNAAIAARTAKDQTVVDNATQALANAIAALEESSCSWWWILIVIAVIILVALWFYYNKKKKTPKK